MVNEKCIIIHMEDNLQSIIRSIIFSGQLIVILYRLIPRSTDTDSVYGHKRSYTMAYTIVYMSYTLRIRPYFAGIHVIVLRSCMTVTVYGEIRRNTEIVYGAYILCIRSYTERIRYVYDRIRWRFSKSY
jgi:hypothetical protein